MSLPTSIKSAAGEPIKHRLVELATNGDETATQAGKLLGKLPSPPPLSDAAFARIEGKLLAAGSAGGVAATSLVRWIGIGVTVVAVSGTAYLVSRRAPGSGVAPASRSSTIVAPPTGSRPEAPSPRSAADAVAPVDEEPAPAALRPPSRAVRLERPRRTPAPTASPAAPSAVAPAPVEESSLLVESKLLGQALHALHQKRDANAALENLSAYEARFPHGLLGEEAQAARVDALIALSRRSEALALLDRVTFTRLARGGELRAVRGELRAGSGRCREAAADFAWALSHQPTTTTTERALFGRAACRQTLRDLEGARADYSDYLERFPSGRFAAAAQAALRELPSK
jgi:hypothetical protein